MSSSTPTHTLSINIYGRGDASLGDGPSHMGIALYECGSDECEMHHIRNPTDETFIYDPRLQPLQDPVLRGRCELTTLTALQKMTATEVLTEFGNEIAHIPEFGVGNCQDWVAGTVQALERAALLPPGEGAFWTDMINKSAEEMKQACFQSDRQWLDGNLNTFEGSPDARFADREDRPIGKLAQNPAFRDRIQALSGGGSTDRPLYVSSPFFSTSTTTKST